MSAANQYGLSKDAVEGMAGFSAGVASTLIAHPLDIIKTRLQVDTSSRPLLNSSRSVFHDIVSNEGPTRIAALYRGLTPNLVGNSLSWGLYFVGYEKVKDIIRARKGYAARQDLGRSENFLASATSGIVSSVFLNPIWVVKTRMLTTSATQTGAYPNMAYAFRSIYHKEGVRGFFNGFVPTIIGISHGALQFVAYEELKKWRANRLKAPGERMGNFDYLIASAGSKVFAAVLTYPHQVVRSRMQTYDPAAAIAVKAPRLTVVVSNIWRNEGILGYYKGLFPNLIRIIPSTCITFLVYENVRAAFPEAYGQGSPSKLSHPPDRKTSVV